MATALITGASNGIGLELAKVHASKGDDLVLVARNKSKLDELKTELEKKFKVKVYTIGKDLSAANAAHEVYTETTKQGIQVDYLVNNAGFGDFGMFVDTEWKKEEQMINLNITTLTQFTKLPSERHGEAPKWEDHERGVDCRLFSQVQQWPCTMPPRCTCLDFSEAVDNEVRDKGVTITALCPGATESGFKLPQPWKRVLL